MKERMYDPCSFTSHMLFTWLLYFNVDQQRKIKNTANEIITPYQSLSAFQLYTITTPKSNLMHKSNKPITLKERQHIKKQNI